MIETFEVNAGADYLMVQSERYNAEPGIDADEATVEVVRLLRRIIRAVDVRSKRLTQETGLSGPQLIVLQAVSNLGEGTTGALSRQVSLSQATVTSILDRLERHGLVLRERSRKDRRIVHTRLTERGERMLESAPPFLQDTFMHAFAALSPARRTEIINALTDVAQMMGADGDDAPSASFPASAASTLQRIETAPLTLR